MRSSAVVAVFATSVAAQSSSSNEPKTGSAAIIINPVGLRVSTLTVLGSSSGTTTYVNSCSDGGIPSSFLSEATAGASSLRSSAASLASSARSAAGTLVLTPIAAPSTTAAARLRRQDGDLLESLCEPLTIKQASESAHVQLKDPTEGAWTADFSCNWKGPVASADLTCTATQNGFFATALEVQGTTSVVIKASEAAKARIVQTVEVVSPASNSATPTASGTQPGTANSTSSGSGAPAATNAAAGAPLPMGIMAFVGGAAGVFACCACLVSAI